MASGEAMDQMTGMNMMMGMNFYWGYDAVILFSRWPGHSLGMYFISLLFVFLLAVAVEVLSVLPPVKPGASCVVGRLRQTAVHSLRIGLAYLVMLAVMSFNGGVFIVAVLGHGIGFFMAKNCTVDATGPTVIPNSPTNGSV